MSIDWTQVITAEEKAATEADAPTDKAAWGRYRAALRDVPKQAGFPFDVEWPVSP